MLFSCILILKNIKLDLIYLIGDFAGAKSIFIQRCFKRRLGVMNVFFALAACFIWGLIFVIPQFLTGSSAIEVAIGRYFFYGLISLSILLYNPLRMTSKLPSTIWFKALKFSLMTNIVYYTAIVLGLRYASPSITALIIGLSPIAISIYGNFVEKTGSLKNILIPSLLIVLGLVLVNVAAFSDDKSHISLSEYAFGLFCALIALVAWSWFVVANAQFLKSNRTLSSGQWSTAIGIATLFWVVIFWVVLTIWQQQQVHTGFAMSDDFQNYVYGSLVLGLLCSWAGNYLWNHASSTLPLSLAGQLTIFETIFGLIFVYLVEQRFPGPLELTGIVFMIGGIVVSINSVKTTLSAQSAQSKIIVANIAEEELAQLINTGTR